MKLTIKNTIAPQHQITDKGFILYRGRNNWIKPGTYDIDFVEDKNRANFKAIRFVGTDFGVHIESFLKYNLRDVDLEKTSKNTIWTIKQAMNENHAKSLSNVIKKYMLPRKHKVKVLQSVLKELQS